MDRAYECESGVIFQGCMQKFCKGGQELRVFTKEGGAQLQAASGRALENNVKKLVW